MFLCRLKPAEIISSRQKVIGFWGAPPAHALEQAAERFPGAGFLDLDVFFGAPVSGVLPDAYCHIIRNCIDNALWLGDRLVAVVAACGEEKCDAGRYAAALLAARGIEVIATVNPNRQRTAQPLLCEAKGPLKKRAIRIMESIVEPLSDRERNAAFMTRCTPTVGFWGTPPHPIEVLELFPDTTHIFGWTRCVEMGVPADLELERQVPGDLPIVFFSQGFCAKAMIARELAKQYSGMYVDVHDQMHAATMAKIEAFIRLSGGRQ